MLSTEDRAVLKGVLEDRINTIRMSSDFTRAECSLIVNSYEGVLIKLTDNKMSLAPAPEQEAWAERVFDALGLPKDATGDEALGVIERLMNHECDN